jgi:DNA helicase HerA-like ATPase
VLVDMTDVRDFWGTLVLGYLDSLGRYAAGARTQLQLVLQTLVEVGLHHPNPEGAVDWYAVQDPGVLKGAFDDVLNGLHRSGRSRPNDVQAHQDLIRALFVWNSSDFETRSIGYSWLQGVALEESESRRFGIRNSRTPHGAVLKGVSWAMSLGAPTVLAFDQVDAIVTQQNLAAGNSVEPTEEQKTALAIIEGIAGGLSAVIDQTTRTLPLVTAINTTWSTLQERCLKSYRDRFQPEAILHEIPNSEIARRLVEARLSLAYGKLGFKPSYPSWPFKPAFFSSQIGAFPRDILQKCDEHRRYCIRTNEVVELGAVTEAPLTGAGPILPRESSRFDDLLEKAPPAADLLDEEQEDALGELVLTGCELLLKETSPPPEIDQLVDADFSGNKKFPLLHVRIRVVFRREGDREEHVCLRVLQRTNPQAYKARLNAAMTASGIDRALPFRKLILIRTSPPMTGLRMSALTRQFEQRGGKFQGVTAIEVGKLKILAALYAKNEPDFEAWLRERRPVSQLTLFAGLLPRFDESRSKRRITSPEPVRPKVFVPSPRSAEPQRSSALHLSSDATGSGLLIGRRLIAGKPDSILPLDPGVLKLHTVIRASAGSGKTVLLKRLVEESALAGIPAILVDRANDLVQMGDAWPQQPANWLPSDAERARRYHAGTEVVIWTPGRNAGRPLQLAPLPDLATAADDDQLDTAVQMAIGALGEHVARGEGENAKKKRGVLAAALRYFARRYGEGIENLIGLLSDLPPEAGADIAGSQKLAASMADSLRAALQTDPLLKGGPHTLDPALLFGLGRERTQISVISLIGLSTPAAQQNFVNQLAMALCFWIKKHPSLGPHGLTGLLVIDEARDFLPAVRTVASKESLMFLAAQARKYGLGLVLATQNPMDLDYNAVAQFSTHFFGRANAPQVIQFVKERITEKGGSGGDIARLEKGQFYLISEGIQPPAKIAVPMCLSSHPDAKPLTEDEILRRARSR